MGSENGCPLVLRQNLEGITLAVSHELRLSYMQDESYQLLQLVERVAAVFVNGSGWNPVLGALGAANASPTGRCCGQPQIPSLAPTGCTYGCWAVPKASLAEHSVPTPEGLWESRIIRAARRNPSSCTLCSFPNLNLLV